MYAKGKNSVPSDSQAREKLALYVYEYLLHVGAQKSAQTFLSEIRWEKNITLGEPPGFLHSWWCVFWDLYCAASERRESCEHSSEAKAFHDYSATQSPVIGSPPGDSMPLPPGFFQQFMSPRYPGGPRGSLRIPNQALGPGNQPLLPSGMDPTRQPGHPNMSGPMQRMTPRGMVPLGPQNYGGGMRPPLNAILGPGMPGINMGPAGGRPWPNPPNNNSIPYSSASPGSYSGPPAGGGPPGTPIMPSPADSNNSSDNMYTMISSVPPNGNRPNFPLGSGADGSIGSIAGMEPHHINGSLGSGDIESLPKSSPGNLSMNNQPGTPRDDGEMSGNFLNPFQSESVCMQKDFFLSIGLFVKYSSHLKHLIFFLQYSPNMTMSV
ncbi:single-stranded DNA-binding protein 2 isoform X4 [Pimephales promelas]|uniref:single-stranded DNA-binding protein 2 isoform X4 n=1 Tax=Pimephales promelas TaxID=90988 RepID=UPI001955D36B|nr:single-stranded DNA-binding protein 2 isoform X4 [Pimephales promelas]